MFSFLLLLTVSADAGWLGDRGRLFKHHGHQDGLLGHRSKKQANYSEATAKANLYFAYGACM